MTLEEAVAMRKRAFALREQQIDEHSIYRHTSEHPAYVYEDLVSFAEALCHYLRGWSVSNMFGWSTQPWQSIAAHYIDGAPLAITGETFAAVTAKNAITHLFGSESTLKMVL